VANLLAIVQDACDEIGIPRPNAVIGSSDPQARQLLRLTNADGKALSRRHDWQKLVMEKTITATATEEQTGGIPTDYDRLIPGSFWNRSQDRQVAGPLSPQRWQMLKSGLIIMPYDCFRIRGGDLLMNPVPTAGDSLAYEYVSKYWCAGASDEAPDQDAWAQDTDIAFLDDELLTLGIIWRYKRSRGLDYAEEFAGYELRCASLAGVDGGQASLDMGLGDDGSAVIEPSIIDGNWSIT
jgi:hypothetical protein